MIHHSFLFSPYVIFGSYCRAPVPWDDSTSSQPTVKGVAPEMGDTPVPNLSPKLKTEEESEDESSRRKRRREERKHEKHERREKREKREIRHSSDERKHRKDKEKRRHA